MVDQEPEHRALLSVDMEGSGGRDGYAAGIARKALFTELERAFEASGIPWADCSREDTGDGMTVVAPQGCSKRRLVHPLLRALSDGLAHHNRYAAPATRIRVRVAVHAGDLFVDDSGFTGRHLVRLARLLDAAPLRQALADAPESVTVAVLVSDNFHDDVVAQGHPGIDPAAYAPVSVLVKETEVRAWLHVVDQAVAGPSPAAAPSTAVGPEPTTPSGGVVITGSQVAVGGNLVGGNNIVR
jgi:hypothetical protein